MTIDRAGMQSLVQPQGPVGRHTLRLGNAVARRGSALAGVDSGKLRRSDRVRQRTTSNTSEVTVSWETDYAAMHHEGTRAHVIAPTKPHGLLVFQVGTQTVFVRGSVNHPGTRPNKFALRALEEIVRRG